jgi:hypothetical protein
MDTQHGGARPQVPSVSERQRARTTRGRRKLNDPGYAHCTGFSVSNTPIMDRLCVDEDLLIAVLAASYLGMPGKEGLYADRTRRTCGHQNA